LGDVAAVNLAQPDFIGFYFSAGPAQISAADAKELRRILDPQIVTVGIFSQTSASEVANLINQGIIQMAQFMGRSVRNSWKRCAEASRFTVTDTVDN